MHALLENVSVEKGDGTSCWRFSLNQNHKYQVDSELGHDQVNSFERV